MWKWDNLETTLMLIMHMHLMITARVTATAREKFSVQVEYSNCGHLYHDCECLLLHIPKVLKNNTGFGIDELLSTQVLLILCRYKNQGAVL